MDWQAFWLTVRLAALVAAVLVIVGLPVAYWITYSRWRWKFLVDAVVAWARANGVRRLLLDVADHNAPAIVLYARMGFVRNGITSTMPPPRAHVTEHQRELRL